MADFHRAMLVDQQYRRVEHGNLSKPFMMVFRRCGILPADQLTATCLEVYPAELAFVEMVVIYCTVRCDSFSYVVKFAIIIVLLMLILDILSQIEDHFDSSNGISRATRYVHCYGYCYIKEFEFFNECVCTF